MENKKNIILNIIIVILVIALACVVVALVTNEKKPVEVNENTLREKLKENITYEYITKPQEEQNAMMAEQERIQNEEMKNEEAKLQEEMINELVQNIETGVKE